MNSTPGGRRARRPAILIVALAALFLALSSAQQAHAQRPTGTPVVRIPLGKSSQGFNAPGVKIGTYGHGKIVFGDLGLTVTDVAVSSARRGTLIMRDGLKVRRGKRSVTIKGLFVVVDGRNVKITGRVLGRRIAVASGRTAKKQVDVGRIAVDLSIEKLVLSRRVVATLKRGLGTFKPRSRTLGRLSGGAFVVAPPSAGGPTVDPNEAYSCQATSGPSGDPAKPVGAVDLSCGYVVWNLRDSWIPYVGNDSAVAPAASLPAYPGTHHVCPSAGRSEVDTYSYRLPVQSGWWDAASSTGAIFTEGGMYFVNTVHGIDIKITATEIRFNGASTQVWVHDVDPTHPAGSRIQLATLNAAAPRAGGPLAPGAAMTRLNAYLTVDGDDLIGHGFYGPGVHFGCIDTGFNF